MSSNAIALDWPGLGAQVKTGRRHGPRRPKSRAVRAPWSAEAGDIRGRKARRLAAAGAAGWAFSHGRGRHGRPSPEGLDDLMNLRRMRGGPFGGGPFGGGPWGGGPWGGGPGGPRGRGRGRARRGDVRLALLRLLAEEPRNGYQLMQTIEERSGGRWRPSPGSVYPTLAQLEDEGLVRSTESDGARHFEITDAGREHLETRAGEPAPWDTGEDTLGPLADIGPLVIGIGKAAWQVATVGDEAQRESAIEVLTETRRALYRILAEDPAETDDNPEQTS
jgi:DNA-binding PadR family transcriptional regulator